MASAYPMSEYPLKHPSPSRQSWWSRQSGRRRVLLIVAPALLLVTILAIGLGVGLTRARRTSNPSAPSGTAGPSIPPGSRTNTSALWQPAVGSTWQIVLSDALSLPADAKALTPAVQIFDVDLFSHNATTIQTLHRLGARVICYFSAGSYEPNRPDSASFQPADLGKGLKGWPGEKWLDVRSQNVRSIMKARIALAAERGCDAIDPDNVDGFQNDNGLSLTQQDTVSYMRFLAAEAAGRGLSTGLKNAGDVVGDVLDVVQFSVNEQCMKYQECRVFEPFINAGKPVLHIEYPSGAPSITSSDRTKACAWHAAHRFSTVLKKMNLDGWVEYCDGSTANTPHV